MADRHESQKYLRYTKVSQPPCEHGYDRNNSVGSSLPEQRHSVCCLLHAVYSLRRSHAEKFKESRYIFHIVDHCSKTACRICSYKHDHSQCNDHYNGLHKVRSALREKTTDDRIDQYEHRPHDHHRNIWQTKQCREELATSHKTACRINREEDQDKHCRDRHNNFFLLMKTIGKIFRQRDRIPCFLTVTAQALGYDQPVDVCTCRQSDGRPRRICNTAPVRHTRQAHEKPSRHVGRLRTHSRHPRSETSPAEEICV